MHVFVLFGHYAIICNAYTNKIIIIPSFFQDGTEVDEPAPFEASDIPQTSGGNIASCEKISSEISPSTNNNRKHCKRKRNPEAHEAYEVMKKLQSQMKQKDDCDVFAENVAYQLHQIPDIRSQMIAKYRINQVLFEVEMSQFDIYSNPPSYAIIISYGSSRPSSAGLDHQFTPIADALAVVKNLDNGDDSVKKILYRITVILFVVFGPF